MQCGCMDIETEPCGHIWAFSLSEQKELLSQGASHELVDVLEHSCVLEHAHADGHVCSCGVAA